MKVQLCDDISNVFMIQKSKTSGNIQSSPQILNFFISSFFSKIILNELSFEKKNSMNE